MKAFPNIRFSGFFSVLFAGLLFAHPGWSKAKTFQSIEDESTLSYSVSHPMKKNITGEIRDFTCKVSLLPAKALSKMKVSAAILFDGKNADEDSKASEMLEAGKYPKVEFVSKSVKREGEGYRVFGNLTFHGRTKPIDFLILPRFYQDKVQVTGGFDVKLSDFDVKRPKVMFVPVDDKLTINFNLYSKTTG
jgi:polyisoprenoid-binding protein YceI